MSTPVRIEPLEARRFLSAVLSNVGSQPVGPLTGKIVYASGGHGLIANDAGVWRAGRPELFEMIEDFGNYDQLSFYADELWRAGATVVPMRPVGHQLNEVVVDNQQAAFTGTWTDGSGSAYFSNTDGNGSRYRVATAAATETAVAKFTPDLPAVGDYPVYAWASNGANRAADQLYRVNHAGGSTEVRVDHQRVGKGWVYLGTYRFRAGAGGSVDVSNKTATNPGGVTIADAIRFGNGRGSVVRDGLTSGQAREDESALYWVEAQAGFTAPGVRVDSSNWRASPTSTDDTANVAAPLRWAAYMNAAPFGQSVYLGFHSNAGGGRGADGLYNSTVSSRTPNQVAWARLVGREITDDLVALGSPPLEHPFAPATDPVFAGGFGEINGGVIDNEFDATIIEVGFHDDAQDAAILRDPVARQRIAQSSAQATIRYFNQFGSGAPAAFLPEAPTNLRTSVDRNGNVTLRWNASLASPIFGGAPTGYRVLASRDGHAFDAGQAVAGTSLVVPAAAVGKGTVYFKVVALNAGGQSPGTAVVAARAGDARVGRVLIVDGFDRLERTQNPRQALAFTGVNSNGNVGAVATFDRVRAADSNSRDYAVRHAQAIANHPANVGVDTADNLAVINGNVNLAAYRAVVWIAGEESTDDRTFSPTEQNAVTAYLTGGGKLLVSGSEVGWDLVASGNGAGFFNNTLHSGYVGDDAGTYAASGTSIFAGVSLSFDNGTGGTYDADFPDRLSAANGSAAVMTYVGGLGGTAATRWVGANGAQTFVLGFPFETIRESGARAAVMRRTLDAFGFQAGVAVATVPPPTNVARTSVAAKPTKMGDASALVDAAGQTAMA